MAGPYGIEMVNVPGLLGQHQQLKQQRLADLYRAQQMELQQRQLDREERKETALAKVFQPKGGDPSSGSGAAPSSTVAAPATQLPNLDQDLPPRTDGLVVNQQALRDLYAVDPEQASKIQKMVYDGNKEQLEAVTKRGEAMAVAASQLRAVPAEQRQAEFRAVWAPYLQERGWPTELLQQADLSDHSLTNYYAQGRTIENLVSSAEKDRDYRAMQDQRAKAEARADRAEGRAVVRFNERDKDRQALSGLIGRISTNVDDLNY
jgi:hypothetical protein